MLWPTVRFTSLSPTGQRFPQFCASPSNLSPSVEAAYYWKYACNYMHICYTLRASAEPARKRNDMCKNFLLVYAPMSQSNEMPRYTNQYIQASGRTVANDIRKSAGTLHAILSVVRAEITTQAGDISSLKIPRPGTCCVRTTGHGHVCNLYVGKLSVSTMFKLSHLPDVMPLDPAATNTQIPNDVHVKEAHSAQQAFLGETSAQKCWLPA